MAPEGHSAMDKAMACHAANPRQDQILLPVSEKIKNALPSSWVPRHVNSPMAWSSGDLLQEGQKERNHGEAIEIDLTL